MISPKICHGIHPFFRNYGPVSTPSSQCIGYSVIKDTVSSYFTKYTMCNVVIGRAYYLNIKGLFKRMYSSSIVCSEIFYVPLLLLRFRFGAVLI